MILDTNFPPDPRVENEAVSLIKEGHEVHLFCFDYKFDQKTSEIVNGINVHRVKISKYLYKLSALAYSVPLYHLILKKKIDKFIVNSSVESLHIHDIQIARSVFWANATHNLPIVLDLHENRPEIMKYYKHVKSLKGKLLISPKRWRKFEFKYIEKADKVITVTKEASIYYQKSIPIKAQKFHEIPNTVRKTFYHDYKYDESVAAKYKDSFVILYLGDTGIRRGLLTAIESLKLLTNKIPNIKLVLVGSSKEDFILIDAVKKYKLESYVDFVGWTDFQLFPSFIKASDIGICPIHRNLHHDTTYANKIFQYMAFGKPIVVSNCPAQANLVEEYKCGLVFKDRDVNDFAEKILSLAENNKYKLELSENAKDAIEHNLNWEITSKSLLKIYENEGNNIR